MNSSIQPLQWKWQNPPWVLMAYLVFSLLATVLNFSLFFAREFYATIVPLTGWTGLFVYMVTLFCVVISMFTPYRSFFPLTEPLIFSAAAGLAEICLRAGREDFGNPYLMRSPWRPLITVALPLFWAALLVSPPMNRWIKSDSTSRGLGRDLSELADTAD